MPKVLINIDVGDINQAESFYCKTFGLSVKQRLSANTLELAGLGSPVFLIENKAGTTCYPGAEQTRHYNRHWTPVHLDIVVENIEVSFDKALIAGASKESEISTTSFGRIALCSDPFGNGFCLIQFNEKGYTSI